MQSGLREWVESALGGRVVGERRELGGGSRELWFVEAEVDGVPVAVVVRVERGGGALADSEFSLTREAVAYRALEATDVPVPRLLGLHPDGEALILERVPGTSRIDAVDAPHDEELVASFVSAVASLHALDPDTLELPGFPRPGSRSEQPLADLGAWRRLAEAHGLTDEPLIAYALTWLEHHPPGHDRPTTLLQGDTGPGNFVHDGRRVTGLVDWELCHLGDPMDDIAWIDMRAGTAGAFGDVHRRDRLYEQATGTAIDVAAVRYYAAFVQLRCALITAMAIDRGGGALGLAAYMAPHHRFLRQLAHDLAEATGSSLPALPGVLHAAEATALDDSAIEGLRSDVMPDLRDPLARLRTRAAMITIEHHRAAEHVGAHVLAEDQKDRRTTLGSTTTGELTAHARAAGARGDLDVLALLYRRAQRALWLWDTPSAGGPTLVRPPARPA